MSDIQTLIETIKEHNYGNMERDFRAIERQDFNSEVLLEINENILAIRISLFEFFEEERERYDEAKLAAIERMREQATATVPEGPAAAQQPASLESGMFRGLGLAGLLAGVTAAVSGYAVGIITNLVNLIKAAIPKIPPNAFDKVVKAIGTVRAAIVGFFETQILRVMVALDRIPKGLTNTVDKVTNFFKSVGGVLNRLFNPKPILDVIKGLSQGDGIIPKLLKFFKGIGSAFGALFTVVSKIAVPITAIVATVKSIFDTLDEVDADTSGIEVIGIGIKNIVEELVSAFVTYPLELLKRLVGWFAGKLGFENVKQKLDSFNIDDIFRTLYNDFIELVKELTGYIGEQLYKLGQTFGAEADPEMERRITEREIRSIDEEIEELQNARTTDPEGRPVRGAVGRGNQIRELTRRREEAVQKLQANQDPSEQTAVASEQAAVASEQTAVASEQTAEAISKLAEDGSTPGSIYVHDTHLEEKLTPLVEATSSFMNTIQSSSNPSSASSLTSNVLSNVSNQNNLSATTIGGSVGGTPNGILNSPVSEASRNVQSAASVPIIISNSTGGSSISTNVNNSSTTMIGGGPSARSSDASHRRLQDRMQGVV